MIAKNNSKQIAILLIGDFITLNLGLYIATTVKFAGVIDPGLRIDYNQFFVAFNLVWFLLLWLTKNYEFRRADSIPSRIWKVLGLLILHGFVISSLWVMAKAYYYSREFLLITYLALAILFVTWRVIYIFVLRIFRKYGLNYRNIIVFGFGDISVELVALMRLHSEYGYKFKGYFDDKEQGDQIKGNFESIKDYVIENNVDEIYCCLPYVEYNKIRELIDFGDESLVKIKLITDFRGFASKGIELQRYEHIPVLNVTTTPLDSWFNRTLKRTFDILVSLFVIIFIFSWLFPLVALWIKLDSRGPIFFKQKRTGINNEEFSCYKFRSMTVNSQSDSRQASKNDCRITRSGRILRSTSIDELPQFFNVLFGKMSVIGPRPHMLKHTEEYSKKVEKFMARHFVKPGITGLAQAKGFRGETNHINQMKNRVKYDRFYVDNWSFWLDAKILFATIILLMRGDENAY